MASFSPSNCSIFSVFPEELAFGHAQLSTCCICCCIGRDVEQVPSMFQVCIHFLSPFLGSVAAMGCMYWIVLAQSVFKCRPCPVFGLHQANKLLKSLLLAWNISLSNAICPIAFKSLAAYLQQMAGRRWRYYINEFMTSLNNSSKNFEDIPNAGNRRL